MTPVVTHNQGGGSYGVACSLRGPMGQDSRPLAATSAASEGRTTAGGRSPLLRGDSVDPLDGRAVERVTLAIRQPRDLLAATAQVGTRRDAVETLAGAAEPTQRRPEDPLGRVLCRRQLRPGEKRGLAVGPTKRGKGTKWMVLVDGAGTPLGAYLDAASPAEVKLLERTLATVAVGRTGRPGRPRQRPDRLIADRGYDSNGLRAALAQRGIEPIIPARVNNRRATHQDGRKLRRYRRRWIVERTIAWIGHFRRLVVRYENSLPMYAGFFHLACAIITLRKVLK